MRHTARALVSVILVVCCATMVAAAEPTGSRWWPFGQHDGADETKVAQPPALGTAGSTPLATPPTSSAVTPPPANLAQLPSNPADAAPQDHWMFKSRKGKVGWPHLTKPKLPTTGLFSQKKPASRCHAQFVGRTNARPAEAVAHEARHRWCAQSRQGHQESLAQNGRRLDARRNRTRTAPGSSSRIAKREVEPPFWKRMFGAKTRTARLANRPRIHGPTAAGSVGD